MMPESAPDAARLLDWDPDVVMVFSPNAALPGPIKTREMIGDRRG